MDLNELQNKWKNLDEHISSPEDKNKELIDKIASDKIKSPLATLRKHCRVAVWSIPFLPLYFYLMFQLADFDFPDEYRAMGWISTIIFSIAAWLRDFLMLRQINGIDVSRQSVVESLASTLRLKQIYNYGVAIAIALAIPMMWFIFTAFDDEPHAKIGAAVGLAIGGVIGIALYFYYIRTINSIKQALNDWERDL